MKRKLIATLAGVALASICFASTPASADKPAEPAQSGVVERFDTRGGHVVGPMMIDVEGTVLPIVVTIGWDDPVTLCTGGPPVWNGVQQDVVTPSGNLTIVVHNSDVPVLVFDASSVTSEAEFIAKCASGELVPIATGTVKQRPIVHENDRAFSVKVKSRGEVTDGTGRAWILQAFQQVRGSVGEEPTVSEWVKLIER